MNPITLLRRSSTVLSSPHPGDRAAHQEEPEAADGSGDLSAGTGRASDRAQESDGGAGGSQVSGDSSVVTCGSERHSEYIDLPSVDFPPHNESVCACF